jgi:outer membrane immunogenic protein
MKKVAIGGVALAASIGTPALAADMALKAPPSIPAWSWTGFYVGANGGYAWGQGITLRTNAVIFPNPALFFDYRFHDAYDLVRVGLNYQFDFAGLPAR